MKIRIKFAKTGVMKFVGHLDVMRYFQKAIRRAELPIAYSEGFSPHMLLSFASPLGVGISSTGEYFDMVLAEDMKTDEIVKRLNATMVEGMEVISARHVPDGKASQCLSWQEPIISCSSVREKCRRSIWKRKCRSFSHFRRLRSCERQNEAKS